MNNITTICITILILTFIFLIAFVPSKESQRTFEQKIQDVRIKCYENFTVNHIDLSKCSEIK